MPDIYLPAEFNIKNVHAGTTFRTPQRTQDRQNPCEENLTQSGFSESPWDSLNVALHVDDDENAVKNNRAWIKRCLQFPTEPFWLNQVHGDDIVEVKNNRLQKRVTVTADGCYSYQKQQVLAIMTADCLPVLFATEDASWIAAAHCGWRSLAKGILKKLVATASVAPERIKAWMGPAISQQNFQVGDDVKQAFADDFGTKSALEKYFRIDTKNRYRADLYGLARRQLTQCGVLQVTGGDRCTFAENDCFYSYRREPVTGRMLSFIWLE